MICFLIGDSNLLSKKELHRSLRGSVSISGIVITVLDRYLAFGYLGPDFCKGPKYLNTV